MLFNFILHILVEAKAGLRRSLGLDLILLLTTGAEICLGSSEQTAVWILKLLSCEPSFKMLDRIVPTDQKFSIFHVLFILQFINSMFINCDITYRRIF